MNSNWEENRIRELLVELRKHDEAQAPDFASVWETAATRARSERRRRYFLRVTAIAAMVVVLSVLIGNPFRRERQQQVVVSRAPFILASVGLESADLPWRTSVLICEWRSPTDFLLR